MREFISAISPIFLGGNVPVANPKAKCPKRRKLVRDLAALRSKGFRGCEGLKKFAIVLLSWGGSQTALEICSRVGFNRGTLPTRWGNQLNGN